jgi:hypothetical protein
MLDESVKNNQEKISEVTNVANQQAALMMVSHMRLDEVLAGQLNSVVVDTEDAAMGLIMRGRKLSDETNALLKHLEGAKSKIGDIEQSNEQIRQNYKALFTRVAEHNNSLASEIAEMLGQIQFQDVVRQRIERIEQAVNKRNALFLEFVQRVDSSDTSLQALPEQMQQVLDEYLVLESHHADSADQDTAIKIELF